MSMPAARSFAYQYLHTLIRGHRDDSIVRPVNRVNARGPAFQLRDVCHDRLRAFDIVGSVAVRFMATLR